MDKIRISVPFKLILINQDMSDLFRHFSFFFVHKFPTYSVCLNFHDLPKAKNRAGKKISSQSSKMKWFSEV